MFYQNIPSNYGNFVPPNVIRTGQIYVANRGLEHINCIIPAEENRGALYLGDVVCTLKSQLIQQHKIRSVLTCMVEPISRTLSGVSTHKILPIRDTIDFPISVYFRQAKQFIDESRQKGMNVLVHCHAGVSRSAAIVCAYLMLQNQWDADRALEFVRQRRYRAKPNLSFFNQLTIFYQKQVLDSNRNSKQGENRKLNNKIKGQKVIVITLEQEIETHDELLLLQQKRLSKKHDFRTGSRNSNRKNQQIKQVPHKRSIFKQQKTNFTKEPQSLLLNEGSDSFRMNKSSIHFKKVYDPKLSKMNPGVENNWQLSPQDKKGPSISQKGEEMMTKSLLVPNLMIGNLHSNNECRTPVKQKSVVVNNRVLVGNAASQAEYLPGTMPSQRISKTSSRQSLMGNLSSYKQY